MSIAVIFPPDTVTSTDTVPPKPSAAAGVCAVRVADCPALCGGVFCLCLGNLLFIFVLCRLPLQRMCLIDTQRYDRQHKTAQS